jgi:hypothetical protein
MQAAHDLDAVADEHDRPLGSESAERADEGRQDHVEEREHRHQRGLLPLGCLAVRATVAPRSTNKRIVSQRAEKNCADMMVKKPRFMP